MDTRTSLASVIMVLSLALSSCGASPTKVSDKATQIQEYTSTIRDGKEVIDPEHGKELGFMYGAVSGVNKINANGVAYIRAYEDGFYSATMNLNILLAPAGKKYVGYLSDEKKTKTIELGELRSIVGDVRHSLRFESEQNLSAFNVFFVMLDDQVIAEGTVKAPSAPIR